jgi:hypothetical protein
VERAIEFYSGYLNAEQNPEFFDKMFTSSAQKKMETLSKTLGTGQYKIAVELAKICIVLAEQGRIPRDRMEDIHEFCAREVRNLDSVPTFGSKRFGAL